MSLSAVKMYDSAKTRCVSSRICYTFPAINQKGEETMQQNKKNDTKAYVISFIAMGAVVVLYSLIFPMYRWVVFIMAHGLDTSKEAPVQQPIPKTGDNAVDSLVEKGQEMLAEIRKENDLIPDAQLTAQMNQLDKVANQIFHTVAEQPAKAPQIRRFMDYYLPTTLKMLTGYRKMDERQVKGENANEARAQIREAMDTVLKAFDKQLDALYQDELLDISTDIDVMETMLRQDGLIDGGVNGQKQ